MGILITPYSSDCSNTPFVDFTLAQRKRVEARIVCILQESFITDERRQGKEFRTRVQTGHEIRKRGAIVYKWLRIMRKEHGYSMQQAIDLVPRALRTELDGGAYTPPPKNRLWTPEGVIA